MLLTSGMRTYSSAAMKKRYVKALTMKTLDTDIPAANSSAARTGPTTLVPFIIAELRLIAPGRS